MHYQAFVEAAAERAATNDGIADLVDIANAVSAGFDAETFQADVADMVAAQSAENNG